MTAHIVAMNIIAPISALIARQLFPERWGLSTPGSIGLATIVQIVLLWAWHIPALVVSAATSPAVMIAMHLSLLAAALWFWICVIKEADDSRWRSIGALLITGKLFCLLGVLLVFAPRPIYTAAFGLHAGAGHAKALAHMMPDQQFAGLLMLIACTFTYLLASVVVATRWIAQIDRSPAWMGADAAGYARNPTSDRR